MRTKEQIIKKIKKLHKQLDATKQAKNLEEMYSIGKLCGMLDALYWCK